MAHFDNFASRGIDYNNRQLFEGFLDFFIHPKSTWNAYWEYHRPVTSSVTTFARSDDPVKTGWKYLAFLHYIAGFLLRLMILPFTAMTYTLSRTFLIVLNPFTAWRNNPWKAFSMGAVWAVPTLLALNNFAYTLIPAFSFSTPFTLSNFHDVSSAFGMSQGAWGMGASLVGGLIVSTFLSIGMACFLHLAKKVAQNKNAFEMTDPRQTNWHDPANKRVTASVVSYVTNNLKMQPDKVMITAPKHRPLDLIGDKAVELNLYNDYNAASNNLRYAYYQQRKPAIWGDTPKRIKKLLNAYDAANVTHGTEKFEVNAIKLQKAHTALIDHTESPDKVSVEKRAPYRVDGTLDQYTIDFNRHVFKKAPPKS